MYPPTAISQKRVRRIPIKNVGFVRRSIALQCSAVGRWACSLALAHWRSKRAMFTAAGFHLSALVDLEILPEIDRVNENARGTPSGFFLFFF